MCKETLPNLSSNFLKVSLLLLLGFTNPNLGFFEEEALHMDGSRKNKLFELINQTNKQNGRTKTKTESRHEKQHVSNMEK